MPPQRTHLKRFLLRTIGAALALCAAAAIVGLLIGDLDETDARIIGTAAVVAGYSLMALPAGLLLDRRRGKPLAFATFGLAALGLVLCVTAIWTDGGDDLGKWLVGVTACGVAAADASALALVPERSARGWVAVLRAVSVSMAFVAAAMVVAAVIAEIDSAAYYRVLGAVVILALLAALLVPLAIRLAGLDREESRYRVRLVAEPGGATETTVEAEDLAAAIAEVVRAAQRDGRRVVRVEPLDTPTGDAPAG